DTGPGVAPEELPQLFERFHRGQAARATEAPGVGLGLAICRALVERHGGGTAGERPPRGGGGVPGRPPPPARRALPPPSPPPRAVGSDTMSGTLPVGHVLGIRLRVHWSWSLTLALVTAVLAVRYFPGQLPEASRPALWLCGLMGALGFFGSVLLHEVSHAMT